MIAELALGLHLVSAHFPERDWHNNDNFGIYVKADDWVVGAYRNTYSANSAYVGKLFSFGPLDVLVGGVTGYPQGKVLPMASPSVKLGATPFRLSMVPGSTRTTTVLHLSAEWKL